MFSKHSENIFDVLYNNTSVIVLNEVFISFGVIHIFTNGTYDAYHNPEKNSRDDQFTKLDSGLREKFFNFLSMKKQQNIGIVMRNWNNKKNG